MTRVLVLSDIHANQPALEAVYMALHDQVDTYWVLGDTLGYGPYPVPTWQMTQSIMPDYWLAGNHDWYVANTDPRDPDSPSILPGPVYRIDEDGRLVHVDGPRPSAWQVALRHRNACTSDMLYDLAFMSACAKVDDNIFLAHALFTPHVHDLVARQQSVETRLVIPADFEPHYKLREISWHDILADRPILHISGHTHIPCFWEREEEDWLIHDIARDATFVLKPGVFYHINPGSVGASRSRAMPCASALLLDMDLWQVQFKQINYDSERVRTEMKRLNYPEELFSNEQFLPCQPRSV
jgi:predicted phosphodiesterase